LSSVKVHLQHTILVLDSDEVKALGAQMPLQVYSSRLVREAARERAAGIRIKGIGSVTPRS
jgi:hypothetical protein